MGTNHIQLPPPHSWELTSSNWYRHTCGHPITSNCHDHTRGHQTHPISTAKHVATNHFQLPPPYTWALTTYNWHHQTRGYQPHSIATAPHGGSQQPHPTATVTHAGANHIQQLPPHTCGQPSSSNYYRHTWAPNHTRLLPPHTWASIISNCHRNTRGRQPHPTATAPPPQVGTQPHPIANTKHVDINDIQLPSPQTWALTTSNCYHHMGAPNHTQLPRPDTRALTKSKCYRHTRGPRTTPNFHSDTRGHKPHPTGTTKLVDTNHIQLPQPHTWASNTSNSHNHTRGQQPHPTGTTKRVGANHIQLLPPHACPPTIPAETMKICDV